MLRVISAHGNENSENTKLLAALALGAMKHLGDASALVDEDIRMGWRMARVGDLALLEKPSDRQSPRRIDCYRVVEEENFGDGKRAKLDPARVLFSLRYQHNATPPDFELLLFDEPRLWLGAVTATLLGELSRRQPHLFDKLRGGG
jgi:hypothetical protein